MVIPEWPNPRESEDSPTFVLAIDVTASHRMYFRIYFPVLISFYLIAMLNPQKTPHVKDSPGL